MCSDRVNLFGHGFQPASFAYPYGSYDATVIQALKDCGYNSGRTVANGPDTIPPRDPYTTEAMDTLVRSGTGLATIQGWITQAENSGGGWVQIIFHHVCSGCNVYSITSENLHALLDWLQTRPLTTMVKTAGEVIGGEVKPPVAP